MTNVQYVLDVIFTVLRILYKPRVMLVLITFLMLFGRLKFYYSKLVAVQNAMIEQLFNEAIVRVSDLGSRELLVNALVDFVDEAKKTGKGLQKLSSKIHGVVDRIIAANNYVHDAVKTITYKSFPSLWLPSRDPQRNQVADVVNDARNLLEPQLRRLVLEVASPLDSFIRLIRLLTVLQKISVREDRLTSSAKNMLLSEPWTRLGGNRRELLRYENRLLLLRDISAYQMRTAANIAISLERLRSMTEGMEDLRAFIVRSSEGMLL
ncbi:hypothetical protein A0H81_02218 [Grifola frondosa]|uniref:Uncharacterized protein n=1 Tax=Grifola frondosa TaxID=5627 RepID=A0A1C7ML50_GRIFR|nr:hypothetical protein A0H81_02218 [Grifola frondosa]